MIIPLWGGLSALTLALKQQPMNITELVKEHPIVSFSSVQPETAASSRNFQFDTEKFA